MSYSESTMPGSLSMAADAAVSERVAFIRRTYQHLAGAIVAFVVVEYFLLQTSFAVHFVNFAFGGSINWLIILGLFMLVGHVADNWARSDRSAEMQYMGLGLYVVAEAILFLPLLAIAASVTSYAVIPSAGIITLLVFGGLSLIVYVTKADFSFLRMGLMVAGLLAMGLIAAALLIGFNLGVLFSVVMVGLASGYVLYDTSNVLHHYRTDQHAAASLALFASIALMFWYIVRLLLAFSWDD